MARNRLLKKEFFTDPKVGSLPPAARLLFEALWVYSDDTGHGVADSRLLKAQAFPYDSDFTPEVIDGWLRQMVDDGMVILYDVEGQHYFEVRNFLKHQVISRPSKFEYPKPPGAFIEHSVSTTGALNEHSSPKSTSKVKSTSTNKEKENGNGEREAEAKPDRADRGSLGSDDSDLTLTKTDGDGLCIKKTFDYFAFAGLDKKKLGKFSPQFKHQIQAVFLTYRTEVHADDEPCCCNPVEFLEQVIERCAERDVEYPKGLLKVKKDLERTRENAE